VNFSLPSRKINLAHSPAAQSPLDFSREPGYGLLLQPIPKLKVFAIVIVEETEASAFWAPAFPPAVQRNLCTDFGTSQTHERFECACQSIKQNDPQVETRAEAWARNSSKPVEQFFGAFRRMIRAARVRVEMKVLKFLLHLKAQRPRQTRHVIPQEICHLDAPMRQARKVDESSMPDEEMLAIPWYS
jgi:hypothetical protein